MKPRILINMHYMEIGGAERALLGMLNAIDTNRIDVDLFINQHTGVFMSLIPPKINLLPENKRYSTLEKPIIDSIRGGHIDIAAARLIAKIHHWLYRKVNRHKGKDDASIFHYAAKYTTPLLPSLHGLGYYDLAISFLTPHNIVIDKVRAKRKIAWIHTDYSTIHINAKEERRTWDAYDKIISISESVTRSFLNRFGEDFSDKITIMENILSVDAVRSQAGLYIPAEYSTAKINICSVGRMCHAKNYDNIPLIAKLLKEKGLDFKWYIIGPGDASLVKERINDTATNDCVEILGAKSNPYPYIARCDIYAQPSRYEGKSVTVKEAQILCRPVIITNYPTAQSQITNGVDGIICEMDNHSIATAIYNLAKDRQKRHELSIYLSAHDYGNEHEIEKIYSLL